MWIFLAYFSVPEGHIPIPILDGGFKYFLFPSLLGEDFHFD